MVKSGEQPNLSEHEPPPVHNASRPIWELVVEDMQERDAVGRGRYGTPLQANNGRDALVDAYQETLDQAVYLRQEIEERKSDKRLREMLVRLFETGDIDQEAFLSDPLYHAVVSLTLRAPSSPKSGHEAAVVDPSAALARAFDDAQ